MSCNGAHRTHQPRAHRVLELFAGVGGFRFALEEANRHLSVGCAQHYEVVWANQWEPGARKQNAARVYEARWGHAPVNRNLFEVLTDAEEMARVDALAPTMLVAGFPCQDYSVAKPASRSAGIEGKKGVLWWAIHNLLQARISAGRPLEVVLLENVDRLLASPAACPDRDFAVILGSLQALGYAVAWQVVNAAEYGYPQRRRRVFITAVHRSSPECTHWVGAKRAPAEWLAGSSPLAAGLPVALSGDLVAFDVPAGAYAAQQSYNTGRAGRTRFATVGVCIDGTAWTAQAKAAPTSEMRQHARTLGDVVAKTGSVPSAYYLSEASLERWRYLKGAKSILRTKADGHEYTYCEGAVPFPDPLDRPSRTIITSEGGSGASRTRHAVAAAGGRLRRLTPEELEELNGFPRGFTDAEGLSASQRAFLMGNALVSGVVTRIAVALASGQTMK
ncbi:DNA (cytosine-5-)-methyltransferase [Ramlibacter sp. MMS24-I3-19]|uniref:DNA (cytosine-5-)-methyltransferase n=1 Tax=Ramlibacter sp. MMS24-I3-19 TaxID=3416606 RepID=UPI003CFD4D79